MRALEPDRLLAPYRVEAGLQPKAAKYPNWESTGLDGHTAGHYLTALAQIWAATGDPEMKRRLDYMVEELAACQRANGNGYVGGDSGEPPALGGGRRGHASRRAVRDQRQMGALVQPAQAVRGAA